MKPSGHPMLILTSRRPRLRPGATRLWTGWRSAPIVQNSSNSRCGEQEHSPSRRRAVGAKFIHRWTDDDDTNTIYCGELSKMKKMTKTQPVPRYDIVYHLADDVPENGHIEVHINRVLLLADALLGDLVSVVA